MTCQDYETIMWRGWRRCGTYYYKYDFQQSCCQPYTIRTSIDEFVPSKSQKQVLRKHNRHIKGLYDGTKQEAMQTDQEEKKQQNNLIDQSQRDAVVSVLK